jgi:hypothetical protein
VSKKAGPLSRVWGRSAIDASHRWGLPSLDIPKPLSSNMVHNIDTNAASPSLKLTGAGAPSPLRSPLGRRDSRDMVSSHRQSFSERGIPNSPRQRNPSLSQQAIQDLINNPPVGRKDDAIPKFAGRDWRSITMEEILVPDEVRFVEVDSTIEAATKVLYHVCIMIEALSDSSSAIDRVWIAQCHSHP